MLSTDLENSLHVHLAVRGYGVPFDKLRAGFRLRECFAVRSTHFAQDDNFRERGEEGLARAAAMPFVLLEDEVIGHAGNVVADHAR
jgi:hypothetical protein